ncbi:hypothetical protein FRC04_000725 [Tulasnella sp. 424]|nr:hypothetical protein FRC04_000725 [Tulasnella sp. 424]KAG8968585.1 hypothetical protein FRC05_001510 [Tulasnella sp. 425]
MHSNGLKQGEGSRPAAGPSGTREPSNAQGDHRNAEATRTARRGELFIHKLHRMIESSDARGLIDWDDSGNFIVRDPKALEEAHLLDRYFNHNSWSSVSKQLNTYGFEKCNRTQKGDKRHVYYHCDFRQGRADLLDKIKSSPKGREPAKTFVTKLQSDLNQMNQRLRCAEENIEALKKQKKSLEDEKKLLEDEKKSLEEKNIRLTRDNNEMFLFINSRLALPQRTASVLVSTQPVGNGQYHAGSAKWNAPYNPQAPTYMSQNTLDSLQPPFEFLVDHPSADGSAFLNSSYNQPVNDRPPDPFAVSVLWPWQLSVPAVNMVNGGAHPSSGPSVTKHPVPPADPRRTFHKARSTVEYIPQLNQGMGGYPN